MAKKEDKPFNELIIGDDIESPRASVFSIDESIGKWIDPSDDAIEWTEMKIYGMPAKPNNDEIQDDDFSSAVQIGRIFGCHIACSLIVNLGADPYTACDDADADLEVMYSVIQEHEEEFYDCLDDIYYLHEIEIKPGYQGFGYEKTILSQLPAIIVQALRIFPSLIMYYPTPMQHDEKGLDEKTEAIIRHRLEYRWQKIDKSDKTGNIVLFPLSTIFLTTPLIMY